MPIVFQCPSCGKSFSVPDANAGRRGRCGRCKNEFTVPEQDAAASAESAFDLAPEPTAPPVDEYGLEPSVPTFPDAYAETPGADEWRDRRERSAGAGDPPRKKKKKRKEPSWYVEQGAFAHWRKPLIAAGIALGVLFLASLIFPRVAFFAGVILSLVGALFLLVGWCIGLYAAFQEDFVHAFFYFFIPFYAAYYLVSRWEELQAPLIAMLVGFVIGSLGGWVLEYGQSRLRPAEADEGLNVPRVQRMLAACLADEPRIPRVS